MNPSLSYKQQIVNLIHVKFCNWQLLASRKNNMFLSSISPGLKSSVFQCPFGSRVVFASYKDHVGQIQKFVMRFVSSSKSQAFISSLKESLNDERNIGIPNTYFSSENLYQNEFISANEVHHRADEALISGYLAANYPPLTELSFNDGVQNTCSEETILHHDYEDTCAPLPPSLKEFLANNCTKEQEKPPLANEEVGLNTRIAKYMTVSSFNDMLIKLELINRVSACLFKVEKQACDDKPQAKLLEEPVNFQLWKKYDEKKLIMQRYVNKEFSLHDELFFLRFFNWYTFKGKNDLIKFIKWAAYSALYAHLRVDFYVCTLCGIMVDFYLGGCTS